MNKNEVQFILTIYKQKGRCSPELFITINNSCINCPLELEMQCTFEKAYKKAKILIKTFTEIEIVEALL